MKLGPQGEKRESGLRGRERGGWLGLLARMGKEGFSLFILFFFYFKAIFKQISTAIEFILKF